MVTVLKMKRATKNKVEHHHHHHHPPQQETQFRKGSTVEVTSDEEGFRGAWFAATLIKPPSTTALKPSTKRKNPIYDKAYVEYQNLISDRDPSVRLREYVNAEFVRPVPPQETYPKPFEIGDIVDAYYSDGWWTGVITKLLQGSRFHVTFQNPPDEIEFGLSDLRFHRKWVNGNWLRPVNQKAAGVMFSVGKKVEISFDGEGHQESWFPATVLEETGKGIFRTQYQIQDKSGQVGHLDATVDSLHIRPSPPHLKEKDFSLLEKVDAFHDCGWRSGVITKVLAHSQYIVFFKQSNEEREFNHSELRPHMEWRDGKWFTSSQRQKLLQDNGDKRILSFLSMLCVWHKDVSVPSDYQNHEGNACNTINMSEVAVSLGSSGSNKRTSVDKSLHNLNSKENHVGQLTPCNEQPSGFAPDIPPDVVGKVISTKEIPGTVSSPTASPISTSTNEVPSEEKISNVMSPKSESVGNNFSKQSLAGDQSSDSHSWGKRVKRKRMKFGEVDASSMLAGKKTTDGFTEVPVEKAQSSMQGKEGYAEGAAEGVLKEFMTIKTNLPIVIGLPCDLMRSSRTKRSCQSTGQDSLKYTGDWTGLDDKELHSVKVIDQFELGESTQRRGRGRPPKSATKNSTPSVPEEANKNIPVDELFEDSLELVEVTTSMDTVGFSQECVTDGSGKSNQMKQKHITRTMSVLPSRMLNEVAKDSIKKQPEKHPRKRGRKRMINLSTVSQVHDSSNATEQKQADSNSVRKDTEMVSKESSNIISDDQPLSKWFEEMHAPTSNNGSSKAGVCPATNVDQCAEKSSERPEITKAAVDNENSTAASDLQCLPFIKNTILWSTIESMEVFKKMPQKPHFRPLEQCKESSREGLAIGFMVTFSSVVERTLSLKFDDPRGRMNDILETLVELERHGFNVEVVRDRVVALLSGKEKQENLENEIEHLDGEIGKRNLEKTKIDEEIDEVNRQITELRGKLSEAMSRKENKDREIASLQSKVEEIKESVKSIRFDLESLAKLF